MDFDKIAIKYRDSGIVDEEALLSLKPLMLSMLKRYYTTSRDLDDNLQELYLLCLEAFKDFDESKGVHVLALIKSRMKYHILNKYKDKWTSNVYGLDDKAFLIEDETSMDDFERIFKMDRLNEIFATLSPYEAKLIYLRFYTEMTYEDLAKRMGISRSKAYADVKGILKKIRKLIKA